MGDGVVEGGLAVEVGLPVAGEELEVIFPAALVEAFALGVRSVLRVLRARARVSVAAARGAALGVRLCVQDGLDDLAGGVKDERVPEVAGDGFLALAAFAGDGFLDRLGDAMGSLMEEDFEGSFVLIAGIGAGDGDAQRIEGGVGPGLARSSAGQ